MKSKLVLPLLILPIVGWSAKAIAHGTSIDYQKAQAIQIDATYATGQPMDNAQVTVYAPNDPSTPWKTGTTDDQGQFTFIPDPSQPGDWEVKVRQAGHGDIITIPMGEQTSSPATPQASSESSDGLSWFDSEGNTESTLLEKSLLAAAGAWGFFGTALFFVRRRKTA